MFDTRMISNTFVPWCKPDLHAAMKQTRDLAMISRNRMQNMHRMLRIMDRDGISGDVVDAGIAAGGSTVFFAKITAGRPTPRQVWGYDAFELFDDPSAYPFAQVKRDVYETHGCDPQRVHLVQGWFQDSLAAHPDRPIALYHVDASSYEGCVSCYRELYDRVQPRGFVVVDNYGADEGCRRATDEFLERAGLADQLVRFGHTQTYFRKPG